MGCCIVGGGKSVWLNVDDRMYREREPMVQSVLNLVCSFMALLNGQVWIDGDRNRDAQLMSVPAHAEIGDVSYMINRSNGSLDLVDNGRLNAIE